MLAAIRQWVIKTMTKGQTGVVTIMPKQEIIEMNVQITAERIMRNGINPNDLKTVGQVENVVEQIDAPKVVSADSAEGRGITGQLLGKKKADVMDMEGNKIDTSKGIMGGKEVPTSIDQESFLSRVNKAVQENRNSKNFFEDRKSKELIEEEIKAKILADNKKGIKSIKINLVDDSIAKIKSMEPMDAMKEANLVAGKKGVYKNLDDNQVKKIMDDTQDHIFERDIPDEDFATGGRVGYAGGSDMGTVSTKTTSANTGLKGGYQNTGTSPVERPGGGGGNNKPPRVVTRTVTKPSVKDKIRRVGNTIGDISYFKNLINFNPTGIIKNVGGKLLMDKILGDRSSLDTEDEYDFSGIEGQTAKVFNTKEDLIGLGAAKKGFFNTLTPKGEALENFRKNAVSMNNPEGPVGPYKGLGAEFQLNKLLENKNTNATENEAVIRDALDQGFLAEESDFINQKPLKKAFADGGRIGLKAGMTKRAFMKLMGGVGATIGAAKSGIFSGFGKGAGKTVAKEVAQQTTSSMPPPYFFKLAEKIKKLGSDTTPTNDRTIAKSLKSKDGKSDYILEEDVTSGDTIIKKVNKEGDEMITDVEIMEFRKGEVVMGKNGKPVKTPDEYEEVTEANARIEGDVFNDPYYSDGIEVDEIIKEVDDKVPSIKYASGGLAYMLGE